MPLRVEIGPKDIAKDSVFLARRDSGAKDSAAARRVRRHSAETLRRRSSRACSHAALTLREENTRHIDDLEEFRRFFTPRNADKPEIHGGFALVPPRATNTAVDELLKELKVTIRCIPLDGDRGTGTMHLQRSAQHRGGPCSPKRIEPP